MAKSSPPPFTHVVLPDGVPLEEGDEFFFHSTSTTPHWAKPHKGYIGKIIGSDMLPGAYRRPITPKIAKAIAATIK